MSDGVGHWGTLGCSGFVNGGREIQHERGSRAARV
jgi:hypothetical protein